MFGKKNAQDVPAFGDAHFATPEETAGLLGEKGIRLGYYRVPGDRHGWGEVIRYNGDGGLMMVAPPRTGKARDVLVGALLEHGQSAIVIDPKGQLAAITKARREQMGQRVFVLNPFDVSVDVLGKTAHYNPMALLDPTQRDWAADCRKLAEGLIARSGTEKDSHWTGGARTLTSAVIGAIAAHAPDKNKTLADVAEIISSDEKLFQLAVASKDSPHAFIRQGLASYAVKDPNNPGELGSFKQNAREQLAFLSIDNITDNVRGDDFRFASMKETATTVYVILPDNRLDVCGKWFRLIVASALDELWRGGRGAFRVLAILDEFALIGHLDVLAGAATTAAGRGVQLWPIIQNIPQLQKDYGEGNIWETFMSGSEVRQFFAPRDQVTAKYVSESAGQRTVTTAGQSVQDNGPLGDNRASDSSGQAGQPLIRPHEISAFGPNEALIIGPQNVIIDALRQPYFHTPEFAGLYAPDPMHKADAAPPPPVNPDTIVTLADIYAGGKESAARAQAARRPLALKLLTWGSSRNPVVNALLKMAFVLTLPLRLVAALVAVPFAIHNKPVAAVLSFVALFGFWEVWEGFAKQPFLDVYQIEEKVCKTEEFVRTDSVTGHTMACRAEALRVTAGFFWQHTILATLKEGPRKAFRDFDLAFDHEQSVEITEVARMATHGTRDLPGGSDIPMPSLEKGHAKFNEEPPVTAKPPSSKVAASTVRTAAAADEPDEPQLADVPGYANGSLTVQVRGAVRFAVVPDDVLHNLKNVQLSLTGTSLAVNTLLAPVMGIGQTNMLHAGIKIPEVGPAYLFVNAVTGAHVLVPVADLNDKNKISPATLNQTF